jgi:catechol 2,3-dioxygenase-like lactoylglutathione lyase family enzyme
MNRLSGAKVVAFAATARAPIARTFYAEVLGLKLVEDTPFALVFDANGTTLRVQKVGAVVPAKYTVLGWEVDDVRSVARALLARGVRVRRYEEMDQDADGIWASPSGALVAWFEDPDGNTLSLTQLRAARAEHSG